MQFDGERRRGRCCDGCGETQQRTRCRRVPRYVEAPPAAEERNEKHQGNGRFFDVQSLGQMRSRGRHDQRDSELPRPPTSTAPCRATLRAGDGQVRS